MALQENVQRGEASEAHRGGFARRIEHDQHRRHQGDAAGEGDQHAAPRDQPQFGKTAIACRQKRKNPDRGRRRRQRERLAGLLRRASQGVSQITQFVPFRAVAHTE